MVFYPLALTKVGNAKYKTSLIKQHIYFALFYLCRCWLHDMRGTILTFFSLVEKLCKLLITVYSMITWAYLSCICMQPLWNIKKVVPLPRYSTFKNYCKLYIIQTFRYKVMHSLLAMHLLAHSLIHTIIADSIVTPMQIAQILWLIEPCSMYAFFIVKEFPVLVKCCIWNNAFAIGTVFVCLSTVPVLLTQKR